MLKKKQVITMVSIAVISFLIGTVFNINLLTMANDDDSDDGRPEVESSYANPKRPEVESSYTISKHGSTIYARNGSTGAIDYSGSDASTVIQSAIDALTDGGKVFIKEGTYETTTELVLAKNLVLEGIIGRQKTVGSPITRIAGHGINITHSNCKVKHLEIALRRRAGESGVLNGIYIRDTDDITPHGVKIEDVTISGGNYGIYFCHGESLVVKDCYISGSKYGIYFDAPTEPSANINNAITVETSNILSIQEEGIFLGRGSSNNILFNRIESCGSHGLHFKTVLNLQIIGNAFTNNNKFSNSVGCSIYGDVFSGTRNRDVNIWGNYFGSQYHETERINLYGNCRLVSIIGNHFMTSATPIRALHSQGARDIYIASNFFGGTPNVVGCGTFVANEGYVTENSGTATDLADGSTIAHGLAGTPDIVTLTSLNATYDGEPVLVSWNQTATDSTNIGVNFYWANGTAISDAVIDVSWYAEYHP